MLKGKSVKGPLHHAIEGVERMADGLEENQMRKKMTVLVDSNSVSYEI